MINTLLTISGIIITSCIVIILICKRFIYFKPTSTINKISRKHLKILVMEH